MSLRPQAGDERIDVWFDGPTAVVHVRLGMGARSYNDYPRRLTIEGSADGRTFHVLYDDSIVPQFIHGAVEGSGHSTAIEVALPPVEVRVLRLRQTGRDDRFYWSIHELELWRDPTSG